MREAYGASCELVRLAIIVLVIFCVSIAVHSHYVRKDGSRSVVLVGIEEYAQTLELVLKSKNLPALCALLGEPHSKTVTVEVALSMDLKLDQDLVV